MQVSNIINMFNTRKGPETVFLLSITSKELNLVNINILYPKPVDTTADILGLIGHHS